MDLAISLATQIGALFIMIGVGYVLIKTDICTISESKLLSQIVLYVSAPCAIINSFQIDLTEEKLKGFLLSIGAAFLYILFIIYLLRYSQRNVILMRLNQCPSCILTVET
ncbi:AEC family transporter [Catenibacterium sp.]|uniref:AEC family transporter n=1 Tax=Catenibacterium sp. TaxID=2049022 RepID=UPI0039925C0C